MRKLCPTQVLCAELSGEEHDAVVFPVALQVDLHDGAKLMSPHHLDTHTQLYRYTYVYTYLNCVYIYIYVSI